MAQIYRKLGKLALACFFAVAVVSPWAVTAQDNIQVTDQGWEANFRDFLTFTLEAESAAEITDVELLYRIAGQIATSRNETEFTPGTAISARFTIDQTEPINYMPPGTELEYWWKIEDAAANSVKTEKERLVLLDNRYDWQTLQNDRLTLYWYKGEDEFGQSLFDRANVALDTLETDIGIGLDQPIKIFIYGSHNDLLGAISTSAQEWTGGQAFTEYGVVVIGVRPGQLDWGLNAMTHEMTHLVIHQATDNPFGSMPRWLDEGIAVYNENQEALDDDFRSTFEHAVANDKLMTLRTLSSPFPSDPALANLAYGQSGAMVKFIVDTYGSHAMAELLTIFAEGALYDEALEQALGENTDSLDNKFRVNLGLAPLPGTEIEAESAPAIEDQPVEEENAASAESSTTAENNREEAESSTSDTQPAAAPKEPEFSNQPVPAAGETNGLLGCLPCLAGTLALLIMGGALLGQRALP